jgi:hypothetical protein
MAGRQGQMLTFDVDTAPVDGMSRFMAQLTGQYEWITAKAMTRSAFAARNALREQVIDRIEGGATAWTKRGLMVQMARPDNLVSLVGWNYGDGSFTESGFTSKGIGVPSGRYMERLASGGDRQPKSSELALRRAGVIRRDQFITPASGGLRIDNRGNVPGSVYRQILSRVGVGYEGSGGKTTRAATRAKVDFFTRYGEVGEGALYIARRIGPGPQGGTGKGSGNPGRPRTVGYPRGFVPALFVMDVPNYERRFDIQGIALRAFRDAFPVEFQKELLKEINRPEKK